MKTIKPITKERIEKLIKLINRYIQHEYINIIDDTTLATIYKQYENSNKKLLFINWYRFCYEILIDLIIDKIWNNIYKSSDNTDDDDKIFKSDYKVNIIRKVILEELDIIDVLFEIDEKLDDNSSKI